jgi:hypothetical protein
VAVCGALHVDSRQLIELLAVPRARREEVLGKVLPWRVLAAGIDYSHWSEVARSLLAFEFSGEQLETLRAIDLRLAALGAGGPEFDAELWSDRAFESDARWEELRSLARAALTRLQWPVELPPPRRSVYVPGGPVDAGSS